MSLTIILPILLSVAALILPGVLKSDHLEAWKNALIAGAVVAIFAGLTVWAGGQFTGNLVADWALFAAAYSALLAGPLKGLDETLQSGLNLPFLKPAPQPTSLQTITTRATPASVPTPIILPSQDQPPKPGA